MYTQFIKYNIIALFLLLLPALGQGQNLKDYRAVVAQVVQCYNNTDADGLAALFAPNARGKEKYTHEMLSDLKFKHRAIVSCKYRRQREDGLAIYRVKYARYTGKHQDLYWPRNGYLGIHLDEHNKITYLGLPTTASLKGEPEYLLFNEGNLQYGNTGR